jgi:hypothetical protein
MWIQRKGCLDGYENFQKQTFRNRCRVFGANGVISLSIPVQLNAKKVLAKDVGVSNVEDWQRVHWRTLESAYKSSPFFEFYAHLWEPLFEISYQSLWQFNLDVHQTVLKCLQLDIKDCFTKEFLPIHGNDARIVFSAKKAHPKSNLFPVYQQVFSYNQDFEMDLSIIDLIFNLGPEAESYLLQLKV